MTSSQGSLSSPDIPLQTEFCTKTENTHNTHVKQENVYHTVSKRTNRQHGQESSSEANRSRTSQETPPDIWNPQGTVLHSQQHATCPYPEPDQPSPCTPPNFLKIHFNNILPSMPRPYRWSSLQFPHQNPVYTSPPPICAACSARSFSSDWPNNAWWGVQTMRFLITWTPAQASVTTHPISPSLIR